MYKIPGDRYRLDYIHVKNKERNPVKSSKSGTNVDNDKNLIIIMT